jgi:electron transfer flavoprotein beta subunit
VRVLVCVKRVPAPGARILITPDGQAVDAANLAFVVSPHEECAVEAAVQFVEAQGGDSTVLTVGPAAAEEQLRSAASVGVDNAVLVLTDGTDWDPVRTAGAIVDAVRQLEATDGPFDLILFGNESADAGGYQVGIRVAHALSRPMVNGASGIETSGTHVTVNRSVDAGYEVYRMPLPAVVGVREGINLPRYPTLRGRLSSKKVEVVYRPSDAVAGEQAMVELIALTEAGTRTIQLGRGVDAVPKVVDVLEEIGVL